MTWWPAASCHVAAARQMVQMSSANVDGADGADADSADADGADVDAKSRRQCEW